MHRHSTPPKKTPNPNPLVTGQQQQTLPVMMKFVGIALVAAAAAQELEPQLSSENGKLVARSVNGMEVERRQTVDGFALSQVVEQQAATISVMQSTLNTFTGAGSPLAMVQGVANDVATRTSVSWHPGEFLAHPGATGGTPRPALCPPLQPGPHGASRPSSSPSQVATPRSLTIRLFPDKSHNKP